MYRVCQSLSDTLLRLGPDKYRNCESVPVGSEGKRDGLWKEDKHSAGDETDG